MVLLDGKYVDAAIIDPTKHKFIGTFRSPQAPSANGADAILCPCGSVLWFVHTAFEHWQRGHFDTPQYVAIKEAE